MNFIKELKTNIDLAGGSLILAYCRRNANVVRKLTEATLIAASPNTLRNFLRVQTQIRPLRFATSLPV